MIVKLDSNLVVQKMAELCSQMLEQEGYQQLRKMLERFTEDQEAITQYEYFIEQQEALQQKEHEGSELSEEEIAVYNELENALYHNETIRQFIYAQREFSQIHHLISEYFTKTVELNELPDPKQLPRMSSGCGGSHTDSSSGGCGCGCSH